MEIEARQAREALRAIAEAGAAAEQNSLNNGTVPLVWGMVVLLFLIGFDVVPRLAGDPRLGLFVTGGCLWVFPVGAAAWTSFYRRRLPVQPRTVNRPRLYFWWGLYHIAVVCGGTALGIAMALRLHQHSPPFGTFTILGVVDAAPLLYVGWTQRRRARGLRP